MRPTCSCIHTARLVLLGYFALNLPADVFAQGSLHQQIDKLIAAGKSDFAKQSASPAADADFLRRVYLDLTGVIPAADEARAFLRDSSPDRRVKLIDRLLASEAYPRRLANVFDVMLMDRRPDKHVKQAPWFEYLRTAFAANKPYDELVRELLSADGGDGKDRAPARFLLDRDAEPHQITKDIGRLFLGMNLTCAQCHDHPLVDGYKQDFYYGVYAFLNRTFLFTDKAKKVSMLAEKADGETTFQSVFVAKVTKNTGPRLPDLPPLMEPKLEKGKEYVVAYNPKSDVRPVPAFSRRALLAGEITRGENKHFRRSAVNRIWALFLGRGLVHPVEFDHEGNPPSHPQLFNLLADEFAARKFDVKWLIREIVLSETYQRSSVAPSTVKDVNAADFGVAQLRPLSPEQLAWSMMQATGLVDGERKALGPKSNETALFNKLNGNVTPFVQLFGNAAGEPAVNQDFEATLDQTLFLSNGSLLRTWLTPKAGNLMDRLSALKDSDTLADELYLSVLTRLPSADEKKEVADYLQGRASDRPKALQDLAWALLASAEFRFNH